jgi:hypothetical protein
MNYIFSIKFQDTVQNIENYDAEKIKKISDFPSGVKLRVGSGSASKWKVGS